MSRKADLLSVIEKSRVSGDYSSLNSYVRELLSCKSLFNYNINLIIDNIDSLMNFNVSSWCFDPKLVKYLNILFYSFDRWADSYYKDFKNIMNISNDTKIAATISRFLKYFNSSQLNDKSILNVLAKYEFSSSVMSSLLKKLNDESNEESNEESNDESIIYLFSSMLNNKKDVCLYFRVLKEYPVYNAFLDSYITTILNNTSDIYEYISAGFFEGKYLDIVNKKLDSDKVYMLDSMIYRSLKLWEYESYDAKTLDEQRNKIRNLLGLIVDDICKNEGINNFSDIKYLDKGSTSTVFRIGSKVIKIGYGRVTNSFPKNPYILEPLLRKAFDINGISIFIEVTDFVDTRTIVDDDVVYSLYKNLRDLGLFWLDPRAKNVGFLLEDNIVHWNFPLSFSNDILGFDDSVGSVVLKAGEPIILDADAIYVSNGKGLNEIKTCIDKKEAMAFEKRYLDSLSGVKHL